MRGRAKMPPPPGTQRVKPADTQARTQTQAETLDRKVGIPVSISLVHLFSSPINDPSWVYILTWSPT